MFEDCLPGKKTHRPVLRVIAALAVSILFHSGVLYILYMSRGTVKILALGKVQNVTIGPALNGPRPRIVGPQPGGAAGTASAGEPAGRGGSARPAEAAQPAIQPRAQKPAPQAGAKSSPAPEAAESSPVTAEFQRSLASRFKPGGDSDLKITLSPPGAKAAPPAPGKGRGVPPDLLGVISGRGTGPGAWGPAAGRGGRGGGGGQRASLTIPLKGYNLEPWARKVVDAVQRNWALPAVTNLPSACRITLRVMIKKDGDVSSIEILETSSVEVLDEAVLRALRASLPFPALPDDFPGDILETFFEFIYDD